MIRRRRSVALVGVGPSRTRLRRRALHQRLFALHAVTPNGELLKPAVDYVPGTDVLVIRLPHRLESPNATLKAHWRVKTNAKHAWAQRLEHAVAASLPRIRMAAPLSAYPTLASRLEWHVPTNRPRVTVRRQVPSRRNFITDRDNRMFAAKALIDCVVDAGFLANDRETDIDLQVTQVVDLDQQDWTVVTIDARPLEQRPPTEAGR